MFMNTAETAQINTMLSITSIETWLLDLLNPQRDGAVHCDARGGF
jgi:hypothetical protein